VFLRNQVSVDVVATSEVSISLTLDPKRSWSDGEVGEELGHLVYELEKIAQVGVRQGSSIISLICNLERTSEILERVSGREGRGGQRGGQRGGEGGMDTAQWTHHKRIQSGGWTHHKRSVWGGGEGRGRGMDTAQWECPTEYRHGGFACGHTGW
jgi:hypothetical protein